MIDKALAVTALENSILDLKNPASILSLSSGRLAKAIKDVPPELLMLSEQELKEELRTMGLEPTLVVNRLRVAFWQEYSNAQAERRKMVNERIFREICGEGHFYRTMDRPGHLAWILCPIAAYTFATEEALIQGIDQLRDILMMPHTTMRGELDPKKASVKVEIVKFLDQRVKGAVVQKTQNLHAHASIDTKKDAPKNLEEVEKQIALLEEEARKLSVPGEHRQEASDDAIVAEFAPVPPQK